MIKHQTLWESFFPQFIADSDNTTRSLMDSAQLAKLPAGQQLFCPGSVCENYLLLLEGQVKIQLISESGREMLLYHVSSGDSCVLTTSCLLGGDCYPAEGITETEVSAFVIPALAFHRGIAQSVFFREFVFKNFSTRLSSVITRIEEVVFGAIDFRLSRILLASSSNALKITHHELATELGSAREVVSRHLKRFERYGWLELKRGMVTIINRQALENINDQ
ncbi:MAG: Crp/Fnr family transcriptional regulator [Methylococcales bacterium]|nr:Crp/Fnr family transcriptional regulator [Methylococcales bacterium]MCK5925278.1 Crp/Fnr family transcriptional regulator [Methylococcales bacterium]